MASMTRRSCGTRHAEISAGDSTAVSSAGDGAGPSTQTPEV